MLGTGGCLASVGGVVDRGRCKGKRNTWQEYAKDVWAETASCWPGLSWLGLPWLCLACPAPAVSCCGKTAWQTAAARHGQHTRHVRAREGGDVAYEIISSVTSIVNSLRCCRWRYLRSCLWASECRRWAGSEATSTAIPLPIPIPVLIINHTHCMRTWHQLLMTFLAAVAAKTLKRQRCIVTSFLLINPHINAKSGCQPVCFLISLAFHTHTQIHTHAAVQLFSFSLGVCVCVCANSLICRQWEKQRHKSPRYNERALFLLSPTSRLFFFFFFFFFALFIKMQQRKMNCI